MVTLYTRTSLTHWNPSPAGLASQTRACTGTFRHQPDSKQTQQPADYFIWRNEYLSDADKINTICTKIVFCLIYPLVRHVSAITQYGYLQEVRIKLQTEHTRGETKINQQNAQINSGLIYYWPITPTCFGPSVEAIIRELCVITVECLSIPQLSHHDANIYT